MTFQLSVLAIDREVFKGGAVSLTVPGREGELQVLAGHTSLISLLKEGNLIVKKENNQQETFPIGGGVLEVKGKEVVALVNF
ncbi:MAG: hypothetical protein Q7R55_00965 [Candidatus Wildermuthbacteria bacterium]|nr:hypothetical protein [Candidatus Wildermuthbacteria bacterium]